MLRFSLARSLAVVSMGAVLVALPARADVNLLGQWQVQVENEPPSQPYSGVWTFSPSFFGPGWVNAQSPNGVPLSGPFNPETRNFSVIANTPQCDNAFGVAPRLDGTLDASGVSFEGTLALPTTAPFPGCLIRTHQVTAQRLCGNGAVDAGEQCDDGNALNGDCCSSTCQRAPIGTSCGTCGSCNAIGTCILGPRPEAACKRPVKPGAAKLLVKNASPDTKDRLQWKWAKGAATTLAELGHPDTGDDYSLCVYDASSATPAFVFGAAAPGGADWRARPTGFGYRSLTLAPDGLQTVTLKAGTAGKATVIVKGKGDLLPVPGPASPLPLPLLVQLQGGAGSCWEARFESATLNDGAKFKAVGD